MTVPQDDPRTDGDTRPVVVLAGNPRPGSRTLLAARTVGLALADRLGLPGAVTELDLAAVSAQVLLPEAPTVEGYLSTLASARLAVVATPVYKASYTGLLKAFLDRYPSGALAGVTAIPVTVSASPTHAFVAEHLLQPLLVELGAAVPIRPLPLVESQLGDLDQRVAGWADQAAPALSRLLSLTLSLPLTDPARPAESTIVTGGAR